VNVVINKRTSFVHLGLADYKQAWDYQAKLFEQNLAIKTANRGLPEDQHQATNNWLIFCEHPHVYTLGKTGKEQNLLLKQDDLHLIGASYYHINRGGDITYHGPGQLVVYPVIDLDNFFTDIHKYMRLLEESVIKTCKHYGIEAGRIDGLTGVWIDYANATTARKICALGVKTSRWVTMHGLAFNVNTDLSYFKHIIPCGIDDKAVTSLEQELQALQSMAEVGTILKRNIVELFEMELT
jgi:lipoyl(octanoyl) transferase